MTDPSAAQGGQPGQPSQEEIQAYLQQLRDAEPRDLIAQAYTMLGTAAEVKLGRPDARVVIDAMGALSQVAEQHLDGDLVERMRNGVVQLQTAQVQAEREQSGEAEQQPTPQAPGAGQPQPSAGERADGGTGGGEQGSMTDRLWIPGREPGS